MDELEVRIAARFGSHRSVSLGTILYVLPSIFIGLFFKKERKREIEREMEKSMAAYIPQNGTGGDHIVIRILDEVEISR